MGLEIGCQHGDQRGDFLLGDPFGAFGKSFDPFDKLRVCDRSFDKLRIFDSGSGDSGLIGAMDGE